LIQGRSSKAAQLEDVFYIKQIFFTSRMPLSWRTAKHWSEKFSRRIWEI